MLASMHRWITFAKQARSIDIEDANGQRIGLVGGRSDKNEYQVKHFVRHLLLNMERHGSVSLDSMKYSAFAPYLPDERAHMAPLENKTLGELRKLVGLSPLLASMWACLAKQLANGGSTRLDVAAARPQSLCCMWVRGIDAPDVLGVGDWWKPTTPERIAAGMEATSGQNENEDID